jgi:hypothetical protein
MENLIFVTYLISVIALALAIWAVIEVSELRKTMIRKQIQNRLREAVQSTKSKTKSLWK